MWRGPVSLLTTTDPAQANLHLPHVHDPYRHRLLVFRAVADARRNPFLALAGEQVYAQGKAFRQQVGKAREIRVGPSLGRAVFGACDEDGVTTSHIREFFIEPALLVVGHPQEWRLRRARRTKQVEYPHVVRHSRLGPRAAIFFHNGVKHYAPLVPAVTYPLAHAAKKEQQGRPEGMRQNNPPIEAAAPDGAYQVQEADHVPAVVQHEAVKDFQAVIKVHGCGFSHGPQFSVKRLPHRVQERRCHHHVAKPVRQVYYRLPSHFSRP